MERVLEKLKNQNETTTAIDRVPAEKLQECGLTNITLRPYQVDGVNWLVERYLKKHGCILGDEMGLGKTCQTIAFLTYLIASEGKGPHLILSPLSVMGNWKNELEQFSPKLNMISYVGSKDERPRLQRKFRKSGNINILLTTYEICLKDEEFLRKFQWHTLVVDEAHRLKNRESLLHQSLLDFDIEHRLLLTGTPVQNNLKELYSLLCFVAPKIFRARYVDDFIERYEDSGNSKTSTELHTILRPFLIRRVKSEVVKDLPKKTEVVLYHGMSSVQKKYYKAILTKDFEAFENENRTKKTTSLMNVLVQLRKCVDHPYLFDGIEPEPFVLGDHLIEASGKLVIIDQLLSHLKANGHKVLMFSQMTRMLDILQDYLGYRGYLYERLDGSVRGEERYLAVKNFNKDDDTFIFLLSTKAGGVGLNLVGADTVIFVDSDFNPQNDLQAAARAHRIGQNRPVKVIRLIGRSTVEEIILKRAEDKLKLTEDVIESGQFSLGADKDKSSLITDDNVKLQDILKFGVDQLFATDDSSVEDVDFTSILGSSADGKWSESAPQTQNQAQSLEPMDDVPTSSLYVFEGTDYSKEPSAADKKAFDTLITAQKALVLDAGDDDKGKRMNRTQSVARFMAELPTRRPKIKLTPDEIEARDKKKAENAEKRAKQAEEAQKKREEAAAKKRDALWTENSYGSQNVQIDSEGEEEDAEVVDAEDENSGDRLDIDYVVGDVTHPQKTGDNDSIVVHCVDDSGKWGYGGLFSALSKRSILPEDQYELAGQMKDLSLGDTHLIPIDDQDKREKGRDYVALIVAQHRDKRNNLSGIHLSALNKGFDRLHKAAKEKQASVHLPRIGHNTPGFNWYGTERLIRKQLATKGIPTHIYYYPRRAAVKRKQTASSDDEPVNVAKKRRPSLSDTDEDVAGGDNASPAPGTSQKKTTPSLMKKLSGNLPPLPTFLTGVRVHFHGVAEDTEQTLRRHLCAYDGDVHEKVQDDTTHIVTLPDPPNREELEDYQMDYAGQIRMVTAAWLEECFSEKKVVDSKKYSVMLEDDD